MHKNGRPKKLKSPVQLSIEIDKTMKDDISVFCTRNGKTQAQFMREAIAEKLKNKKENV